MADRRPLTEGLKPVATSVDARLERDFVYQKKNPVAAASAQAPTTPVNNPQRTHFSCRIRSELVSAIKRTSLELQLAGVEPNTLQDILEQAIKAWLNANGCEI